MSLLRASELIITNVMFRVGSKYLTDRNIQRGKANGFKGNIMFLLGFFLASVSAKSGNGGFVRVTISQFFFEDVRPTVPSQI